MKATDKTIKRLHRFLSIETGSDEMADALRRVNELVIRLAIINPDEVYSNKQFADDIYYINRLAAHLKPCIDGEL